VQRAVHRLGLSFKKKPSRRRGHKA
jgi:transposase